MHKLSKAIMMLVLCTGWATPLWVGAAEQAAVEGQIPAAPAEKAAPAAQADTQAAAAAVTEKPAQVQAPAKAESFTDVVLDRFIEQEQKAAADGKKIIKMMSPLSFEAKLKRQPEEKPMEYVYTAMELSGIKPLPEVHHRMFVESGEGRIIPVYVEANAVKKVNAGLKEEGSARFQGYHVYSYAKGPAILVVDFAALP